MEGTDSVPPSAKVQFSDMLTLTQLQLSIAQTAWVQILTLPHASSDPGQVNLFVPLFLVCKIELILMLIYIQCI